MTEYILTGLKMANRIIMSVRQSRLIKTASKLITLSLIVGLVLFGFLDMIISPLPKDLLQRSSSTFVYSRKGRLLTAYTSSDYFWRKPVTLDQISPRLVKSVIAIEDQYFYYHPGINLVSLFKSVLANARAGKTVRGGSTITMQIARMIEPKERTIRNKIFEIFRALQLEMRYSKTELLEMYFNLTPFGGNIEGVGAATLFYFNKKPSELSWSEAVLLTAIPGSPERFRPDKWPERGQHRTKALLDRLLKADVITPKEYTAALVEEIPSQRKIIPQVAPHLSQALHSEYSDSSELYTTIRYEPQNICERLAIEYNQKYQALDIHNLALVIIDNDKSEVIALVGSPDFADARHGGQVDASSAPRSPGSALKPFVYGLAFDKGILSPEKMVADIPVNFAGYRPVNYDETCRGVISVREALIHSLNIPAVNVASLIGLKEVHHILERGGLTTLNRPYYDFGLPLVLGACEVRLTELTNLYASLARGGRFQPVKTLAGAENEPGVQLFSPEVCYLLTDILIDLRRPELADSWTASTGKFPIAWKTGTSYGRRDAWTIGYTRKYTVGVWAGNCSGEGSIDLVGASIAAPLMFRIFSAIGDNAPGEWPQVPDGIGERLVCGTSGQPVGRFCSDKTYELFIIGKSPMTVCTVHRPILVDRKSGKRLRANCTFNKDFCREIVEVWPPRIATWQVENGLSDPLPPYDPNCLVTVDGSRPVILSPENGAVFEFVEEIPAEYQKIRLQASTASGGGTLHWFLDGEHLAAVEAKEVTFYVPTKGRHALLCVDNAGGSASSSFVVQ